MVKSDLDMKSFAKHKVQLLIPQQRGKRVTQGQKIRNFLKNGLQGKILMFSDKKDFTVNQHLNCRNNRYTAKSTRDAARELKYIGAGKHPSMANMIGVIMSDGKALPPLLE